MVSEAQESIPANHSYRSIVVKNPLSPIEHRGAEGVNYELFELGLDQFVVRPIWAANYRDTDESRVALFRDNPILESPAPITLSAWFSSVTVNQLGTSAKLI